MDQIESEIRQCVKVLQSGGTILYPTDTIWGIGCDATNDRAVEKVYHLKKRLGSKSLIILLDDSSKLNDYVERVPEIAWDLLKSVDTPLTIIFDHAKNLASNVIAEDHSIAIRIVKNEFCRKLIHAFGKPIVSSSANVSGDPSPLGFKTISEEIIKGVDHSVHPSIGILQQVKASRIIKLGNNGEFQIIRK